MSKKNTKFCYLNDTLIEENKAFISIKDRGFKFGDAVFETIRVENYVPYKIEFHRQRLILGAKTIKLPLKTKEIDNIFTNCLKLINKNNIKIGFVRITISRGCSNIGYLPQADYKPTIVIETVEQAPIPQTAIDLWLSKINKIPPTCLPVKYKLAQGLNSILVKMEASENQCFDGVLTNTQDYICETSSANIFWVKDKKIYTPALSCGVLKGNIRDTLINYCNLRVVIGKFTLNSLEAADEVFITNSSFLLLPVKNILPIGLSFSDFSVSKEIKLKIENHIKHYAQTKQHKN